MQPKRADRSGWRRRAKSDDAWQCVVTLVDCTQGDIWHALQQQEFLAVALIEADTEWEYAITLAGQTPDEVPMTQPARSSTYMDRMMRAQGK